MIVKHILQTKTRGVGVISVPPDASITEAARLLAHHHIGALLVIEPEGGMVGIISERDIIRGLAESTNACLVRKVSELMTRDVLTCRETDSIDSIMETMTNRRIRHVPVLNHGEQLLGIVTIGDVVKISLESAHMDVDNLRNYVSAVR